MEEARIPCWEDKSLFFQIVEASKYVKDKVTQCFTMQLLGLEPKRLSEKRQEGNHYCLAQRQKKTKGVTLL